MPKTWSWWNLLPVQTSAFSCHLQLSWQSPVQLGAYYSSMQENTIAHKIAKRKAHTITHLSKHTAAVLIGSIGIFPNNFSLKLLLKKQSDVFMCCLLLLADWTDWTDWTGPELNETIALYLFIFCNHLSWNLSWYADESCKDTSHH